MRFQDPVFVGTDAFVGTRVKLGEEFRRIAGMRLGERSENKRCAIKGRRHDS